MFDLSPLQIIKYCHTKVSIHDENGEIIIDPTEHKYFFPEYLLDLHVSDIDVRYDVEHREFYLILYCI